MPTEKKRWNIQSNEYFVKVWFIALLEGKSYKYIPIKQMFYQLHFIFKSESIIYQGKMLRFVAMWFQSVQMENLLFC